LDKNRARARAGAREIRKINIHAFDLDHTLFSSNSSYCFGRYLCSKKLLPFRSLLFIIGCSVRHSMGLLPIVQLHEDAFKRLFLGRSYLLVQQWAEEFIHAYFEKLLYPPAVAALKSAQEAGHLTAILSSTPDFIVEPIAKRLNIPFWDATRYAIDSQQKFCGIDKLMLGQDKALCLAQLANQYHVGKNETYAYSDSHLDLPFLLAAGKAYGVNPNRKLRRICGEKGWPVI
jgi:HAD superfamily hydrolase (TIGR01490 family)